MNPADQLPLPGLGWRTLQLVTTRSRCGMGVTGPVLLLGEWATLFHVDS